MKADRRHFRPAPRRAVAVRILALLWLAFAGVAAAQPVAQPDADPYAALPAALGDSFRAAPWPHWELQANRAQALIERNEASRDALGLMREQIEELRKEASDLAAAAGAAGERLETQVAALDPVLEEEARTALAEKREAVAQAQRRAEGVTARAEGLIVSLAESSKQRLRESMTANGPTPANPANWITSLGVIDTTLKRSEREIDRLLQSDAEIVRLRKETPLALLAIAVALTIFFILRRAVLRFLTRRAAVSERRSQRLVLSIAAAIARIVTAVVSLFIFVGAVYALRVLGPVGEALLEGVGSGLLDLVAAYVLAAALFAPAAPQLRAVSIGDEGARAGFRASLLLGLSMLLAETVSELIDTVHAPHAAETVFTFVVVLIGSVALWRLARIGAAAQARLAEQAEEEGREISVDGLGAFLSFGYRVMIVVAVVSTSLAALGYDFAARFLFFPFVDSIAVLVVAGLTFRIVGETVEIYLSDDGRRASQSRHVRLIPLVFGFLLLCAATPILALVWGASVADLTKAYDAMSEGLVVGDITISPIDFVMFAIVFAIGYTLTRAAQKVLKTSVLPQAGVNAGAADAVVSGVGYIGVVLAALAAISAAGLDLSNLAIVAGALSVGIGFGLQTIVNNFVSGIILLVERPIRVGDWIEVGGVHGTVKKVNVRSTEIQTFDRSSYILPNSDLISGAVTNYTLGDTIGRVIVPIGVAYGSDTRLVERLLLEMARDHPMVLASPPPAAYLMNFGADALEFELRGYLRDVNWVLSVKSDLNFKVAERFAEEGIEIPFAQRDINIRNPEAVVDLLRGPASGEPPRPGAARRPDTPPRRDDDDDGEGDGDHGGDHGGGEGGAR